MIIGICDDMQSYREVIKKQCSKYFEKNKLDYSVVEFTSGQEVLSYKDVLNILVLDIEMGEISGIEVKDRLIESGSSTAIIFMTSHGEQIKEAFGKNVFGFIEKKENNKRFIEVLDKIRKELNNYCLIEIEKEGTKDFIRSDKIIRIEVENQYIDIYAIHGDKYIKRISLNEMENELVEYGFYRINRKHMVNLNYIEGVLNSIKLVDGYKYKISDRLFSKFKKAYIEYVQKKAR